MNPFIVLYPSRTEIGIGGLKPDRAVNLTVYVARRRTTPTACGPNTALVQGVGNGL
jgi:hypothetical protein